MARVVDDVHYALRALRKSPGFTLVAVLTIHWVSAQERTRLFYAQAMRSLSEIPGVQSVAIASQGSVNAWLITQQVIANGRSLTPVKHAISHGYFRTLGVPIAHGRSCTFVWRRGTRRSSA